MAQVLSVGVEFGRECRALFTVLPGFSQLGADQAGLELRCLGSFIAAFAGGAYIKVVLEGDVHWENAKALFGLTDDTVRDEAAHTDTDRQITLLNSTHYCPFRMTTSASKKK